MIGASMKIFLVTLKIDNGATFETSKFLVRAETSLDAIGIGAAAFEESAGYEDSIKEMFVVEFKEGVDWMKV